MEWGKKTNVSEEMEDETGALTSHEVAQTLLGIRRTLHCMAPTVTRALEYDTIASSSFVVAFSLHQSITLGLNYF